MVFYGGGALKPVAKKASRGPGSRAVQANAAERRRRVSEDGAEQRDDGVGVGKDPVGRRGTLIVLPLLGPDGWQIGRQELLQERHRVR